MSALAHIGHGVEKKLITAIVAAGNGRRLLDIVENRPGVAQNIAAEYIAK